MLETEVPAVKGCRAILRRGNVNNIEVDGLAPAVTDNGISRIVYLGILIFLYGYFFFFNEFSFIF